ncbi:metallophosphoesterase family protein [Methanobrevibacter curvatus]|uniref:3',5'-cyclic adenosine monophosphate phosphodiesterase CpdA n=1 Tax=Methanobrevibacter curvatus TaxID=49547 RepID=A0A162FBE0_9EURY|nr:metallophosphoesterase [Methanobrevibacter curvatus]KZX10585.1 3',5'-cyclic adenosine monophosphate phosphodiesterase CpdA [Methanobrevibacter curvatus]
MTLITHISDIHFGSSAFNEEIYLKFVDEINNSKTDFIILTGDLTDNGYYSSFLKIKEYLNMFEAPLLSIPGNHDARNVGFKVFEDEIGERNWARKISDDEILIVGLDSSEPDLNNGNIGRFQQLWLEDLLQTTIDDSIFSIVALHHHLIPIPNTGRERNELLDAGDVLKSLVDKKVNLVISGHKHVPYIWKLEDSYFISAGSLSSNKLRGKILNSYNTYDISKNNVEVLLNQIDGSKIFLASFERD